MSQLLTGLRVMRRQGLYGFMAVFGLAIGLAVAVTALLFVWQETHYDSHIEDAENIYLVDVTISNEGRTPFALAKMPGALAERAQNSIAGVMASERVFRQWSTVSLDDRLSFNHELIGVDEGIIDLLGITLESGSASSFHDNISTILISQNMANRLYGTIEAVGQTVDIDTVSMTIGGVFRNMPALSHMEIDIIMSMRAAPIARRGIAPDTDWSNFSTYTYLHLEPSVDVSSVARQVEDFLIENYQQDTPAPDRSTFDDIFAVSLQALPDLHLNDTAYLGQGIKPPADTLKLAVFSAISVLIVVIACINHINMATVRSIERSREVALRKVVGAGRGQLVRQFMLEAFILVLVALILALVLVEVSAPFAGTLLGTTLEVSRIFTSSFMGWLGLLLGFVVLVSGLYPAYVASAAYPGQVLSSNERGARGSKGLRSTLVVFQFTVSIVLAIGAAVIWSQLKYARTADLGFNADNVIGVFGIGRPPELAIQLASSLKAALEGKPGIVSVSGANSSPAWDYVPEVSVRPDGAAQEGEMTFGGVSTGLDFFQTLEIIPLAGRTFGAAYGIDADEWNYQARSEGVLPVIINERAVSMMGFDLPTQALGTFLEVTIPSQGERRAQIVGVVPNVHFRSFKNAIQPMVYYPDPGSFSFMMIRFDPNQRDVALKSINEGWARVLPSQAISSEFLSASLTEQYNAEALELKTVSVLAGLGILIAVFGQYGLAAYSTQSRRREISIRKVLGARVRDILQLFIWQFSKPVFLAMVAAWPLAFYAMTLWLENFVYRVTPNPLWFVLAGLAALLIALLTVAGHAFKAARTAPIEALRYE